MGCPHPADRRRSQDAGHGARDPSPARPHPRRAGQSDARLTGPPRGRPVAVQEYGISNLELLQGLKERGAEVTRVPVYRWGLPQDLLPLRAALQAIADGQVRVVLFTNANQVENVMQVARDAGLDERVRAALARGVVASVGPIASESLRNHGLAVDVEPPHPKMGPLVREASLRCHEILNAKRDVSGGAGGGRGPASRGGAAPGAGRGRPDRGPGGASAPPARGLAAAR